MAWEYSAQGFMRDAQLISVVAPMHNEEGTAHEFHRRVCAALEGVPFELVLVDDGSFDRTDAVLREIAESDQRVKVISLSRNFGHQTAITAGLDHARGDAVVMIDADLQDPPELIPDMLDRWRGGADIVYAVRTEREGETAFKRATARWFYRLISKLSDVKLQENSGDFRLLDRRALAALLSMRERNRYLRGMTVWVGFTQTAVEYKRDPRYAGETKFSVGKMMRFALDAIASFSHVPLQMATIAGFLFAAMAFLGIPLAIVLKYTGSFEVPGVTTTVIAVLLLGGIQLIGDRADRRVRRAHLRRGQAAPALPRARAHQHRRHLRGRAPAGGLGDHCRNERPAEASRPELMRVCVVGAGVAGLVCALRLSEDGHTVDVYERWPGLGGQAATIDVGDDTLLERYYHHWFTSDRHIVELCEELGVADPIEWHKSSMAFFVDDRSRPFTTPLDLLRFSPLPLRDRLRMGLAVVKLQRAGKPVSDYEGETAREWIVREMGERPYEKVWGPLLRGKFGSRADDISMAWMWGKLVTRRKLEGKEAREELLGYPGQSFEPLFRALVAKIEALGGRVHIDRPVVRIERGVHGPSRRAGLVPARPGPARVRRRRRARAVRRRRRDRAQRHLHRDGRRARVSGVPRQARAHRVPHGAVPAAGARSPVLAVLLDQHRGPRAALRRAGGAHEHDRSRALRRPALSLRRQLRGAGA